MGTFHLSTHQQEAINWIVNRIQYGAKLVAITGYAGVGKSSIIGPLRRLLQAHGRLTVLGTPTNRAAMVVHQKGEKDAATIHSLCMVPYFDEPYTTAKRWLEAYSGGVVAPEQLPALLHTALEDASQLVLSSHVSSGASATMDTLGAFLVALQQTCRRYSVDKALRTVGIFAEDHFAGFGPREPQPEILLIDEASMVGAETLAKVQQVYRQIVLIGDPGQLPPVSETPVLATVEAVDLTEIHRQALDSPLIHLAHHVRNGGLIDKAKLLEYAPAVEWAISLPAAQMREMPLIVWRNQSRVANTLRIRERLGYTADTLAVGEPLVCRVNSRNPYAIRRNGRSLAAKTLEGKASLQPFCNNACYHVQEVHGPREVTLLDDLSGDVYPHVSVHMEETDGTREHPESTRFRFAYCLTAHTAQGGEWPVVAISVPELRAMNDMSTRGKLQAEAMIQWRYTAVTRARERLIFLGGHTFE